MTYAPIRDGSFTAWAVRAVPRVLTRAGRISSDREGRSRNEIVEHNIKAGFGSPPEMERRRETLYVLMSMTILAAFALGVFGLIVGGVIQAFLSPSLGGWIMRAIGAFGSAPLFAIGIVWAGRTQVNEFDYRRWVRLGQPEGFIPRPGSQPKDVDLFLAAPIAVLFAMFFLTV